MRIVAFLPVLAALASAAEYSAADPPPPPPPPPPPSYAPGKPPIPPLPAPLLLLIAKLLEALKLDDYSPPAPYAVGDGVLPDPSYAEPPLDLLSLLKLVVPKYAPKAALKISGLYANVPPYALPPALLNAAYGKPAPLGLGLVPPYAPPPLNYVYPPGLPAHPPALPPYPLPLPKLPLGYPGYAPPALNLPPLPLLVITKEELESLKLPYGAAPVEEVLPPADYIPKPKKLALKKAPVYAPLKVPAKPALVKAYAAPAKIKPAVKVVKTYTKLIKPDLPVVAPIPAIPAGYAVEDVVAAPIAPAYAAVAAEAPVDLSPAVEARSASGNEPQHSTIAGVARKAESTLHPSTDGGESARALPSEPSTSPQKTISRIS